MQAVSEPRLVLFDLETLPNLLEVMKVFTGLSDFPGKTLKASINSTICFGYKVFGEKKTKCINAWDFSSWKKNVNDDRELVEAAFEILKDADAVITHNGDRFDWKFFQTRLLAHGMDPLPKLPSIDTCRLAKRHLLMFNNKLDTLAKFLGGKGKLENGGWDLWVRVSQRDPAAMKLMTEYCKVDVESLEEVFRKLRPFATNMPNHNLWTIGGEKNLCPNCGSTRLKSGGLRATKTVTYRRYTCLDCGSPSRTNLIDRMPRSI